VPISTVNFSSVVSWSTKDRACDRAVSQPPTPVVLAIICHYNAGSKLLSDHTGRIDLGRSIARGLRGNR
jgi:hypothetical protein